MTVPLKTSFAALLFVLMSAPVLHAASPRLLAYYEYSDQWNVPPYNASTIPYHELTHIIHSNILPAWAADGSLAIPPGFLDPQMISRAHAAGVKVEVCISGDPELFVTIDADPELRATFAQNLANFAISNGYDGVDFDYEVPNNNEQAGQFTLLIQDLRELMPAGQYLISAAVSSSPGDYGIYDFVGMTPLLDFYNVMTYDFHGPWTNHSGHNSPLYLSPLDPGQEGSLNTSTVNYLNLYGVPAEQINLGTAFYGYAFDVFDLWAFCADHQLCGNQAAPSVIYTQVEQLIASGQWTEEFDDLASAPYLLDARGEIFGFITYDNPSSTEAKVDYALNQNHLGGIFMWELSQDYDGHNQPLLSAMHSAFVRATKAPEANAQLYR
jgi:chitinase